MCFQHGIPARKHRGDRQRWIGSLDTVWERFLDYELGHLHHVAELFKRIEGRDPAELIPDRLPEPVSFASQREFVRQVLTQEVDLRARGPDYVGPDEESEATLAYRTHMNSEGSPSEAVAAGYEWSAGTELDRAAA